jgi:hypothetical protein
MQTLFQKQVIAGLEIALVWEETTSAEGKTRTTASLIPSIPARVRTKKDKTTVEEPVILSDRAFTAVNDSVAVLEQMGAASQPLLPAFCKQSIEANLGKDVAAAIAEGQHHDFVLGIRAMFEAYHDEMTGDSVGTVNPVNSLCNFLCATIPAADFASLTSAKLSEQVNLYLAKALEQATNKALTNGVKSNGLAMIRPAKK